MAFKITDHHARYMRMSAQGLGCNGPPRSKKGIEVVQKVVGIQAQDLGAAFLSIHTRGTKLMESSVEDELLEKRSMIRSWFMRGTLHLVAARDMDWLLPLLAPVVIKNNRRRYEELRLGEADLIKGVEILRKVLASKGPLARHELAPFLREQGVNTAGQALVYLINRAAWEGVLCCGPEINGKQAYVLLSEWIRRELKKRTEGGHGLLAERFLAAYGPASPKDFASWSGLPGSLVKDAWKQLDDRLFEVEFPGGAGFILKEQASRLDEPAPQNLGVLLLPKFDTFLLGYADRSLFVAPEHVKSINAGGGILRPVLLVDGRVGGTWRINQQPGRVTVQVEPFARLSSDDVLYLEAEVERIGGFLKAEAALDLRK